MTTPSPGWGQPGYTPPPTPQRSWPARHKFLTALGVLLVLIIAGTALSNGKGSTTITGQSSTVVPSGPAQPAASAKPKTPTDAPVGGSLHVTDGNGLDVSVQLVSVTPAAKGAGQYASPPQHGTFAVAKLLITDSAGAYSFNPLYLKFQLPDGTTFDAFDGNAISAGFEPMLSAGQLGPGQKTGGLVVFDVPAPHGKIQLTDPLGGVVGQWVV